MVKVKVTTTNYKGELNTFKVRFDDENAGITHDDLMIIFFNLTKAMGYHQEEKEYNLER